jgi:hypothetical protein
LVRRVVVLIDGACESRGEVGAPDDDDVSPEAPFAPEGMAEPPSQLGGEYIVVGVASMNGWGWCPSGRCELGGSSNGLVARCISALLVSCIRAEPPYGEWYADGGAFGSKGGGRWSRSTEPIARECRLAGDHPCCARRRRQKNSTSVTIDASAINTPAMTPMSTPVFGLLSSFAGVDCVGELVAVVSPEAVPVDDVVAVAEGGFFVVVGESAFRQSVASD